MWDEPAHRRVGRRHLLVWPAGRDGRHHMHRLIRQRRHRGRHQVVVALLLRYVVTRTIGRSIDSNHIGASSVVRDQAHRARSSAPHRPNRFGILNGLPLATRISGARRRNSSTDATACTSPCANRVDGGSITLSRRPITSVRTAASRSRPNTPGSGPRPRPNGGTPGDRSGGVYGERHAHGMPPACLVNQLSRHKFGELSRLGFRSQSLQRIDVELAADYRRGVQHGLRCSGSRSIRASSTACTVAGTVISSTSAVRR